MPKGWTTLKIEDDIPIEKTNIKKQTKVFNRMMATTPKRSVEDLKKHSDEIFDKKKGEEDFLLAGLADNRLKSKDLIKKAFIVKKQREKAADKKEKASS